MPCAFAHRAAVRLRARGIVRFSQILFLALATALVFYGGAVTSASDPHTSAPAERAAAEASASDPRLAERDRHEREMLQLARESKLAEALEHAKAKLAIERQIYGREHVDVAPTYEWLARLSEELNDFAAARRYLDEQIKIYDRHFGGEGWQLAEAKRRRALVDRLAALDAGERERFFAARRQSELFEHELRYPESLAAARQMLEIAIQRLGEQDYYTILALRRVAEASLLAGQFDQVERQLRECLQSLERAVGREHPEVAATLNSLGNYYRAQGDFAEAAPCYRRSSEILRAAYGPDHAQTGVGLNNLAIAYEDLEEYERAIPLYRDSLRIALRRYGEDHDEVRITRDNLARVLALLGDAALFASDYAQARKLFDESTEIRTTLYGEKDWRTVDARESAKRARRLAGMSEQELEQYHTAEARLAEATELRSDGKPAEALAAAEAALAGFTSLFGEEDRLIPNCINEMAIHLDTLGREDEALERYRQAERLFRRLLGDEHLEIGINLANQANTLVELGKIDEAIALQRQVVDLRAKIFGKNDSQYADAVRVLGVTYRDRGDYATAEPLLREAVDILRPLQVYDPATFATALYDLSNLYREQRHFSRAVALLEEAMQRAADVFGEESADVALYNNELGALHYDQAQYAAAVPYYERAIELYTQLEGRDTTNVATCLDNLGRAYAEQQDYARAERVLREALEIRRRLLGRESSAFHGSLASLAAIYRAQADYQRAEPLLTESVELCRKVEGETSPVYVNRLLDLAQLYDATDRAPRAAESRVAALSAIEQGLADEDQDLVKLRLNSYAGTLGVLVDLFHEREDAASTARARRLRIDALTRQLGEDHWQTIDVRFDLAEAEQLAAFTDEERRELATATELLSQARAEQEKARYREALPLAEQSLAIRRRVLGNESRYTAAALETLSLLHTALAEFAEAKAELDEALGLRRKLLGEKHPDVVSDMSALGILSRQMGDFALAEEMYLAALANNLELYGELSTQSASAMNNLAVLYEDMGRPAQALNYARRSVEIHTQLSGEEHLDTINALNTLGAVYLRMEDTERAIPIFLRVMNLYKEILGPDHPDYIESVHIIATVLSSVRLYELAEKSFQEALAGREKTVGKDHPSYANTLNGLALLHWNQGKLDLAVAEHEQVLGIRLRRLGTRHTRTAQTQTSLARAYLEQGNFARAEELLKAALETRRAVLDPASPDIGSTLYGLALLYLATDRRTEARAALEESIALDQRQLDGIAAFASEPSLRDFLNSIGYKFDRLLGMAAADPTDQTTARAALTWTLRRKAAILDTLCEYRTAESIFRHDPAIASRIEEVKRMRQEATNLAIAPPPGTTAEQIKEQQDKLRNRARDIEEGIREELNRRRLTASKTEITLESVAASLPAGTALIEYIRLPTYDFKEWGIRSELGDHYGAFVILPQSTQAVFIDLGPAETVDAAVAALRTKIEDAPRELRLSSEADLEADYATSARRLFELIFEPLRESLAGAKTLFVAPDNELNRVPFAALLASDGKYLLESHDIAYLSCGRDLLRTFPVHGDGTLVFAGPDYDLATPARAAKAEELLAEADAPLDIELAERSAPLDVDLRALRWNRLPGAEGEAQDVGDALAGSDFAPVEIYVGANALEDIFKASKSPRILHIATHGFFLTAAEPAPESVERGPADSAEAGPGASGGLARLRLNANPLLRSGIVLAGANDLSLDAQGTARVEDGWVTAEEISLLDYRGTELVVLSACESGLGDIDTRDGVYGLRRAFFHAGAHNLLTSLFKVPDAETRRLMAAFYGSLAKGESKLSALHAAQRKILAERRAEGKAAHPFFWASFILVGEGE